MGAEMSKTIVAVYENGVFRPKAAVQLREGEEVRVQLPPSSAYEQLLPVIGIMPREDAEELNRIVDEEFGQIDPDDWK